MGPLGPSQRQRLVEALETAERLILAATCEVEEVDVDSADAVTAVGRYFAEIDSRFAHGFDPATGAARDLDELRRPHGCFLVLRADAAVVACGGLQRHSRTAAEVKRMWVDPEWRGCGLGMRMLEALEDAARGLGYREVCLDTNASLTEAIAMYERAGYRRVERYNDNPYAEAWFRAQLASLTRNGRTPGPGCVSTSRGLSIG
jgi:GNAT superfamily N-acetyltransferase